MLFKRKFQHLTQIVSQVIPLTPLFPYSNAYQNPSIPVADHDAELQNSINNKWITRHITRICSPPDFNTNLTVL
jgi:hypothetical protein